MVVRALLSLILILAFDGLAAAEVKSVATNGFEVASVVTIAAPADRVKLASGLVGCRADIIDACSC